MRRNLSNLSGKYGKWTIVARDHTYKRTHYLCRCDCNRERVIRAVNLVNGKTTSCGSPDCRKRVRTGKSLGELTGSQWYRIRRNAATRSKLLPFTITQRQALTAFRQQKGLCALSGLPIVMDSKTSQCTASLDRIDSSKGYTPKNIQWVHKDVNLMKRDFPQDRFIELCRLVASSAR